MKVSIIIPVYNEALAIHEVLRRVCEAQIPEGWTKEIIVVDDGSVDTTTEQLIEFYDQHPNYQSILRFHYGILNHGKGVAVRVGLKLVTGDIVLVQDGDLEYSPKDYMALMEPFKDESVKIVYGSRFFGGPPKGMRLPNLAANYILSTSVRVLYGHALTDEATGYKLFRSEVMDHFLLNARGFEFCPEFTAKVLLSGFEILEIPISYNPRGILEGKKIRARDGFIAMWWLLKLRFKSRQAWIPTAAQKLQASTVANRKRVGQSTQADAKSVSNLK